MKKLSDKELEILNREIDTGGLTYTNLRNELLDHLCCCIEEKTEAGMNFQDALRAVRKEMGTDCIREIQEDTLLLINQKYRMMKKLMYIMGILAPVLIVIAAFFKVQHWPGSGVLLVAGWSFLAAVYLPLFIIVKVRDTRKEGQKVRWGLYLTGLISGIIIIVGTLFKIMHWPGAGFMISLAGLVSVLVFIPVLIINAVNDKVNQVQSFTVLVLVLSFLALTFMNYSLNISKSVLGAFGLTLDNNMNITQVLEQKKAYSQNRLTATEAPLSDSIKNIVIQADELNSYLIETMQVLASASDKHNTGLIDDKGNIDYKNLHNRHESKASANLMLGIGYPESRGKEIAARMIKLRTSVTSLGNDRLSRMAEILLSTSGPDDGSEASWVYHNFEHLPMVSVLVQLSDMRVNTMLMENEVLDRAVNEK